MSLISDPHFLIHSLRLSYLRNVEDPYGPRIISLDPSYASNPYILASSLADTERWPELAMPSSPHLSEEEGNDRPSGFPGATGLKYTRTIMGPSRSGALGLRVDGKRASTSKRLSNTPRPRDAPTFLAEDDPLTQANKNAAPSTSTLGEHAGESWAVVTDVQKTEPLQAETPPVEQPPVVKQPQFIPRFKGAAEMEARRKMRMLARRQAPGVAETKPQPPPPTLNPELSSSEEGDDEEDGIMTDSDSDFGVPDANHSLDDGFDEFDPEFAATRTPGVNSDSASEIMSPNSALSTSHSSHLAYPALRTHARLSPVSEIRHSSPNATKHTESSHHAHTSKADQPQNVTHTRRHSGGRPRDLNHLTTTTTSPSHHAPSMEMTFSRRKVPPLRPLKSALTPMMAASSSISSNPFTDLYSSISGRAESSSMSIVVFFPHAREPAGKPMELNVRKDASFEEAIGFALWSYWEEGWLPKLDEGLKKPEEGEEDEKWETRLSAVGWIMRIAEDDGEVDDEFPPPDRTGKISKFNFDAYAVIEATPTQVQQNKILESKIQRRPSRTMTKKPEKQATLGVSNVSTSAVFGSTLGSVPLSTSLGPSSSHGPQIFLRIRVADTADTVHISTTIPVSAGMYMQEALELVCRKRKIANANDYALCLADMSILIPLDRTVASLQGKRELVLVKRSMLPQYGIDFVKGTGRTTDPNASIFKRISDTPEVQYSSAVDVTAAYKKYTIYRKMPMMVTRHERTLAIDGVYIHIMPSTNKAKAVFDNVKTTSYHIKSIVDCRQSTKSSSIFKLVVQRDGGNKRYDFEAESPKLANEIVQTVRSLKNALERSGTVNKSRRSRHVV